MLKPRTGEDGPNGAILSSGSEACSAGEEARAVASDQVAILSIDRQSPNRCSAGPREETNYQTATSSGNTYLLLYTTTSPPALIASFHQIITSMTQYVLDGNLDIVTDHVAEVALLVCA
jgi:hypothetical protein